MNSPKLNFPTSHTNLCFFHVKSPENCLACSFRTEEPGVLSPSSRTTPRDDIAAQQHGCRTWHLNLLVHARTVFIFRPGLALSLLVLTELRRIAFPYEDGLVSAGGPLGAQMQVEAYHLSLCKFLQRSLADLYPDLPWGSELAIFSVKDEVRQREHSFCPQVFCCL